MLSADLFLTEYKHSAMESDYLVLTDGTRLRIELNWNVVCDFRELTGKEVADLAAEKANLGLLRSMAWCSAKEGEACDGRELKLTEVEFGRLCNIDVIKRFNEIFTKQVTGSEKKKAKG